MLPSESELIQRMRSLGKTEIYIHHRLMEKGSIHVALLDPDKTGAEKAGEVARICEEAGTSLLMIGGSLGITQDQLDAFVKTLKAASKLPIVLFPSNISGLTPYADAVWFMSLLNSENNYYITGAQALGAPLVKRYQLEAIPLSYVIVGSGGAAGYIGQARPIPYDRPEIIAAYSLAGEYLGMRFVYLEAGSGAVEPVPERVIKVVRKTIASPLIVGGGVKSGEEAKRSCRAGADIVVTGTTLEESEKNNLAERISSIVRGVEDGYSSRKENTASK
jgi:phosphoglycerol geranylgeranyltransferase